LLFRLISPVRRLVLTLAVFLVSPGAGAAEASPPVRVPSELTLSTALDLYRTSGLDLLLADAAVESAHGNVTSAHAIANPSLGVTGGKSFVCEGPCRWTGPPLWAFALGDQGALMDWVVGKRGLRIEVAEAALRSARALRADTERTTGSALKQQFVTTLVAQEAVRFARETGAAASNQLALTQRRYDSGAISEADLARVKTQKLEVDQTVTQAEVNLVEAKASLAFLLGVRGELPTFTVREDALLGLGVPEGLHGASEETLLAQAKEHRPDLVAQQAQADRAESAVTLAHREVWPDIALGAQYSVQGLGANAISPPTVSFGVTTSLPIFYQQQGEVAKAAADLRTQQLQQQKLLAQLQADVQTAWSGYVGAREQAVRMQQGGLLDSARRARDLVEIQYQKGAASLLEYLDAQRTYISVNLEALQDLAGYWTSVFKLEQAVGRSLE
jgi:cobalt-zinc-cadmium efflux system outer membrane protein